MTKRTTVLLAQDCMELQCTSQSHSSGVGEWVRVNREGREVAVGSKVSSKVKPISPNGSNGCLFRYKAQGKYDRQPRGDSNIIA